MNNKLEYKYCICMEYNSHYTNTMARFEDLNKLNKVFNEKPPTNRYVGFDIGIIVKNDLESYNFSYCTVLSKKMNEDIIYVDFLDNIAGFGLDNDKVMNDVKLIYDVLS